jgi:hypothetical protein
MTTNCEFLRRRILRLAALASCLAGFLTLAAGCGTDTYGDKFQTRLSDLQRLSPFASLTHDPTDDLPVNLRVPTSMTTHVYNLYSADTIDPSKVVARDRVLPPFLQLRDGFRRTYEGQYQQNGSNSSPYFLYVWMFDAPRPKDGLEKLRDLVRLQLRDAKANWEPVEVKTPDGKTLSWQRLQIKADQTFETEHNGSASDEKVPGVFELWSFESPGWDVLLGWRAPEEAWDKAMSGDSKISELPQVVAGTISFSPDQARNKKPVKPDGASVFAPRPTSGGAAPPSPDPSTAPAPTGPAPPGNEPSRATADSSAPSRETPTQQFADADGVLRRFLVALISHDEAEIRATTIENPDAAILWQADPNSVPGDDAAKQLLNSITFQHLKIGDEVSLPGGGKVLMDEGQVNERRQQVTFTGNPVPFTLVKAVDGWKVDPGTMIAARKAAAATAAPGSSKGATSNAPRKFVSSGPTGMYRNDALHFSIQFPPNLEVYDDYLNNPPQHCSAAFGGQLDDGTHYEGTLFVATEVKDSTLDLKARFDEILASELSVKGTILEQGELEIDGNPCRFFVSEHDQNGKPKIFSTYVIKKDKWFGFVMCTVDKPVYSKIKDSTLQFAKTFRFEGDAAGPNPPQHAAPPATEAPKVADAGPSVPENPASPPRGRARLRPTDPSAPPSVDPSAPRPAAASVPAAVAPAAPAVKQGPVQIEFTDGVAGSIEFPAGFQQNGKSPEASTAPPMPKEPGAAVEPADSIKIQVVKLGQGVVYNNLRSQTINTETQGAVGGKVLERGATTIAGQTGEFIVVAIANPGIGAANDSPRKRIVYLVNVPSKHLAVKISADMAEANYKTLKDELKKCVRSLKFD